MNTMAKQELRLPSFWLALAGGIVGISGWIFTLGVNYSRMDTMERANAAQDTAIVEVKKQMGDDAKESRESMDRLRREMQAGFDKLNDKLDAARRDFSTPAKPRP